MNKSLRSDRVGKSTPLYPASLPGRLWSTSLCIRFCLCDQASAFYTPRFFDISNGRGIGHVNVRVDFSSPCVIGDMSDAVVAMEPIGHSSGILVLHTSKGHNRQIRGDFTVSTMDYRKRRSTPIPQDLRIAVHEYVHSEYVVPGKGRAFGGDC